MTTVPTVPRIQINPVATNNALDFYWAPPANNGGSLISSYQLQCTTFPFNVSIDATSTYFRVSGLAGGQNYNFLLAATNYIGTGPYVNFILAQPGVLPGGPRNFTVSTVNESTVNLVWTFSTNVNEGENRYFAVNVIPESSTLSSYYQGIYENQRSYQFTNLVSSFYTFKIYSISDAGWSINNQFNVVSTFAGV